MTRVLVVDDSALMRRVLSQVLAAAGLEVSTARDGAEAIQQLHAIQPDVITLDVQMPTMDGLACLDRIMLERPCPVLMLSSLTKAGADVTLDAMHLGAVDFIAKPAGAISLSLDEFGPLLVDKVKAAARARVPRALRLRERVRLQAGGALAAAPPKPRPIAPPRPARDSVVLVGTSTGGPPALEAVLAALPADFPWPVIVAQHMPATFTGALARRLDRLCALHVAELAAPTPLRPGTVHIGRGDADIIVAARPTGAVVMPAPAGTHRWHPSVDRLVTSAMAALPPATLIGVLMTGMGDDGATAMTRLRHAGGHTIAEAEESAIVWGMPGELVRAGGAELVAPLEAIGRHLVAWAS